MLRRSLLVAALAAAPLSAPLSAQQAAPQADPWAALSRPRTRAAKPTTAAITPADLQSRVYLFADDSMGGRLMGTPGNAKGAEYIARELQRLGLEPAGDNGTYFQALPWKDRALDDASTLTAGGRTFRAWDDFVPRDQGPGSRNVAGVPVVYGGDFADAANRLATADAAGKFVIISFSGTFAGNPPHVPNRALVNQTYPNAAGIAVVAKDDLPAASIASYRQTSQFIDAGEFPAVPSYLYISTAMAEAVFGRPLAGLAAGTAGTTLGGEVRWRNTASSVPARNVVAILRGSDPALRNSYVAIGAHNDHIGMQPGATAFDSVYVENHLFRQQGADDAGQPLTAAQVQQLNGTLAEIRRRTNGASARPDSIFNGADDDGSGSMGVLEVAEYLASLRVKPKRSILFVWHVGEELGLFGSQWYTDHPTVPRDSIVAQLNVDMIGRGGADDVTGSTLDGKPIHGGPGYVQLIGSRRLSTQLGDWAEAENTAGRHGLNFDYALDANGHPQNIYCRSDHYMYARYGIPIIFFTTGGHADYHQVTDEPQFLDYDNYAKVTTFIAALGQRVANSTVRPVVDKPVPGPNAACRQ
ncbi:MAG: M28 family peptidase [Gemmatimonadaceae bacterium]|nr:M28 family peptidase [Gemmatimonadaceae bacterium]